MEGTSQNLLLSKKVLSYFLVSSLFSFWAGFLSKMESRNSIAVCSSLGLLLVTGESFLATTGESLLAVALGA